MKDKTCQQNLPDYNDMTQEEFNKAFEALPLPLQGPPPPGIPFHAAIEASYMHQYTDIISEVAYDIIPYIEAYDIIPYIEYTDIICDIVSDIVPDIQYTDIVYDIICDIISYIIYDIFTGWIGSALENGSCSYHHNI